MVGPLIKRVPERLRGFRVNEDRAISGCWFGSRSDPDANCPTMSRTRDGGIIGAVLKLKSARAEGANLQEERTSAEAASALSKLWQT